MELKDGPRLIVDRPRLIVKHVREHLKNYKILSRDRGVWAPFIGNTNRQYLLLVHPLAELTL